MKIARLHDGRKLKFSDEIDDEAISTTVQGLLKKEMDDKKIQDYKELKTKNDQEKLQKLQQEAHDKYHKEKIELIKKLIEAVQVVSVGMHYIEQKVPDLTKINAQIETISKAVSLLDKSIKSGSSDIVEAITSPKKLIFDKKKRPIGVKIDDGKEEE